MSRRARLEAWDADTLGPLVAVLTRVRGQRLNLVGGCYVASGSISGRG